MRKMAFKGAVGRRRAGEMGRAGGTRAHGWHGGQAGAAVWMERDGLTVAVAADDGRKPRRDAVGERAHVRARGGGSLTSRSVLCGSSAHTPSGTRQWKWGLRFSGPPNR